MLSFSWCLLDAAFLLPMMPLSGASPYLISLSHGTQSREQDRLDKGDGPGKMCSSSPTTADRGEQRYDGAAWSTDGSSQVNLWVPGENIHEILGWLAECAGGGPAQDIERVLEPKLLKRGAICPLIGIDGLLPGLADTLPDCCVHLRT